MAAAGAEDKQDVEVAPAPVYGYLRLVEVGFDSLEIGMLLAGCSNGLRQQKFQSKMAACFYTSIMGTIAR